MINQLKTDFDKTIMNLQLSDKNLEIRKKKSKSIFRKWFSE